MINKKILLADVNILFANNLASFLKNFGYNVYVAVSVSMVQHYYLEWCPDLIIVSEDFSEIDYIKTINECFAEKELPSIFILTIDPLKANTVFAYRSGISDYINKQATFEEIIHHIELLFTSLAHGEEKYILGTCLYLPILAQILCSEKKEKFLPHLQNKLLHCLCPQGKIVKSYILQKQLWPHKDEAQNDLEVLLHTLRKNIRYLHIEIENIRGVGYRLKVT